MKNCIAITIGGDIPDFEAMAESMAAHRFTPSPASAARGMGWYPPRPDASPEHGALLEAVAGCWHLALMIERRMVPGDVLKRKVAEMAKLYEQEVGRKPGKKQRSEMKAQATMELLPQAFPKRKLVRAFIDTAGFRVYVESGSLKGADEFLTALAGEAGAMNLHLLQSKVPPELGMARWIKHGPADPAITLDHEGELISGGEEKARVKFTGCAPEGEDMQALAESGMVPISLGFTYQSRVSAVLQESGALKKIDTIGIRPEAGADAWEGQCALISGELPELFDALMEEFGGEAELPIEAAAKAGEAVPA